MIDNPEQELELIDSDSINETKALIQIKNIESEEDSLISIKFMEQIEFKRNLLNAYDNKLPLAKLDEEKETSRERLSEYSDVVVIQGWKNVENISSRLIEHCDDNVVLECLIDREEGIYEEREFRSSLFTGYNLDIGNLFYLRIFERPNEIRIEIHDDPELTLKDDFPKLDFVEKYKSSRLFKGEEH